MPRPPTQSGQPNEAHMASVGSHQPPQRPMTGPASRPPLKNASSPMFNQDITSDYGGINPLYNGSQGSQLGDAVQPSNFNFAPRTAGPRPPNVSALGATNMLSEADFDRATDIEDADDSE